MPSEQDPQVPLELKACACHLVQHPLTVKEQDPEMFRLILRHETTLDRLFTQRLGYRLHLTADTARLFKTGLPVERRTLLTASKSSSRTFHPLENLMLALVLGATVAGPGVLSLRDLVERVRSAAVEADIRLEDSATTRRAVVTALEWMIGMGLAQVLFAALEAYVGDESADAVLRFRPDRIALLPFPALGAAREAGDLTERARARAATRQWMRCQLVEEPVLYRTDLTEAEWSELRRRVWEEERLLEEMFGLSLEVRAEGFAAIDPEGGLTATSFPTGNTVSHAALLLIARLHDCPGHALHFEAIVAALLDLHQAHRSHWSSAPEQTPQPFARQVAELLVRLRLAEWAESPADESGADSQEVLHLLPAAGRFLPPAPAPEQTVEHRSLW